MRYTRILKEAQYAIETRSTVRQTAKVFGVSKSTVWTDLAVKLQELDESLAGRAGEVLKENKAARGKRGAEALWKKRRG